MNALATLKQVRRTLDSIKTLDEAVKLRDQAATIRHYVKERDESQEIQNRAAYLKVLCERKIGEFLIQVPRASHGPGRGKKEKSPASFAGLLEAAGIAETTAKEWQCLARLPQRNLDALHAQCNKEQEDLTAHYALSTAREYMREQKAQQPTPTIRSRRNGHATVELATKVMRLDPPNEAADDDERELYRLRELVQEARQLCEPRQRLQTWAKTLRKWEAKLDYWIAPRVCSERPTTEKET